MNMNKIYLGKQKADFILSAAENTDNVVLSQKLWTLFNQNLKKCFTSKIVLHINAK